MHAREVWLLACSSMSSLKPTAAIAFAHARYQAIRWAMVSNAPRRQTFCRPFLRTGPRKSALCSHHGRRARLFGHPGYDHWRELLPHSKSELKGRPWPRPRRGLFLKSARPGGGQRIPARGPFCIPACKRPRFAMAGLFCDSPALEIVRDDWRSKNTWQLSAQAEAI